MNGRRLQTAVAAMSAIAVAVSWAHAPATRADTYRAKDADLITSHVDAYHDYEKAYKGPKVWVQGQSVNRDTYQCAHFDNEMNYFKGDQIVNDWVAVPDDVQSSKLSFRSNGTFTVGTFAPYNTVYTWNWSDTTAHIRVITSCTNDNDAYPGYYTYGNYLEDWIASLWAGTPDFVCLVQEAFQWSGCGSPAVGRAARAVAPLGKVTQAARPEGNTFALVNGSNTLELRFRMPRTSLRPPAIYFSTKPAAADCVSRRMGVQVNDAFGYTHLVLRCSGLGTGATAQLKVRPGILRTFRLHEGKGSGRVHLDKPPGSVKPLVYVGTRPPTTPCTIRSRKLRMARRTFDLRISSRCGHIAQHEVGELFVGGLLTWGSQ